LSKLLAEVSGSPQVILLQTSDKLACPSSQKKARHGEAVGPLSVSAPEAYTLLAEVSGSPQVILLKISDKLACPSSQKKARHGEAVGPLSKLLAEVSGSPQVIQIISFNIINQ
jgi:hypothetical protein